MASSNRTAGFNRTAGIGTFGIRRQIATAGRPPSVLRAVLLASTALISFATTELARAHDGHHPLRAPESLDRPGAVATIAQASPPAPGATQQSFAIPPQSLSSALTQFARQSGLQIAVDTGLVTGRQTPGVQGRYTAEQALQRLIAGTGLNYRFTAADTITIERAVEVGGDGPLQLAPIQVAGAAESAYGPVEGYRASRSATATRTDTPILDIPVSVQVVPQQVIENQAPRRLRDVYRNISGVQADFTGGNVSATEVPIIRGFQDFSTYRNGFRTGQLAPVDFANVERVEVLKGPASVLFGLAEPGGLLNIVTKRPLDDTFVTFEQEIGSYNRFRTTIDANTPLIADGGLLGRINLAYTHDDTFRDHDGINRFFIAPTLTWRASSATELIVDFSYSYEKYPFDHGLAFNAAGEPVADVSTFLGEPDFRSEREEIFAGYTFTHDITNTLKFRNMTSFQYNENRLNAFRHFGSTNPDNTVDRSVDRSVPKGTVIQTIADLGYVFDLGPTRHQLLFGVDGRLEPEFGNQQDGPRATGPFPIDIVNPQYGQFGDIVFDSFSDFDSETKWVGIYIQDQISLLDDRLHLLLGGRYDYVDQFVKFVTPTFDFEDDRQDDAFSGRIGALYKLTDWLSPYVNISQSFNPVSPFTVGSLEPERGFQVEGGLKLDVFDERLTSTLAVYRITKDNVPVSNPDDPDFSINGGELRSQGFEVDIVGALAPGWQVIATYAYTSTEVIESDVLPIGSRFRNVPRHSANLWSGYDFQPGSGLEGLGFGAGVFGTSDKLGNDDGTFKLDGFVVADVAVWYRHTLSVLRSTLPIKAQLNVHNLFDKEYFESSNGTASVFPGAPRTIIGSIAVTF